jgi:hypothetical protein
MHWLKVKILTFLRGIKNLILWSYLIWNDRDFDFVYIYAILLHKLKAIERTFKDPKKVQQVDEARLHTLRYISIAVKLLERLIEDNFKTEADHAVYRTIKMEFVPCSDNPELSEVVFHHSPPREVLDEIRKREMNLKNKTRRLFFLILDKRIERWWD